MGSQVDPIRKPLDSNEEDQTMTAVLAMCVVGGLVISRALGII